MKLSNIEAFLKSSTLCVIIQKYLRRHLVPDASAVQCFGADTCSGDAFEFSFMHALIRSQQERVGEHVKDARIELVENKSVRKEAEMSMYLAIKHQSAGRSEMALKLLKHAAQLDPRNSEILNLLGEAFEKMSSSYKENKFDSALLSHENFIKSLSSEQALNLLKAEGLYTKALISDPLNVRATKNRKRMSSIVKKIDQQRFREIDLKVARFYLIPESDPGLRRVKIEHYFLHIYHSNAIEGNTLSLAQTRSILETRLAVGGKSLQEQNEVLGLDAAFKYLNNTLLGGFLSPISLNDILELHRRVLSFIDLTEAGHLRQTQVFVGDHAPPPASMLPELMEELVEWMNSEEALTLHPIELAALTHWKLVYIHPFYDGNGRTARLLMNLILMRAGLPPAIIRQEDRCTYYESLKDANAGDVRPFIRFIADSAEKVIDEYLRASEKKIIVTPSRPTLTQLGSLIQYTTSPLHFPWLPHEQFQGHPHAIYGT
ncbi:hypothetical protein Aperf_G00000030075 [Anoplocephala perfoliata]